MNIDTLIHMANRVAEFFQAMPDAHEGEEGVRDHLRKFWEPRMRQQLTAHFAAHGDAGMHPLVATALRAGILEPAVIG